MKINSKNLLCLILLSLVITSCCVSPVPIYRLNPVFEETKWFFGQEIAKDSDDHVTIGIAFSKTDGRYLVFDVEIANVSDEEILVAPEKFFYLVQKKLDVEPDVTDTSLTRFYAVDPEKKLLEIDKDQSQEKADHANNKIMGATFGLLDVAADIATINQPKTDAEKAEEAAEDAQREVQDLREDIEHQNTMTNLTSRRDKWEKLVLRKTTLKTNQTVSGKVYYPVNKDANFLNLNFPIDQSQIKFIFQQEVHKP